MSTHVGKPKLEQIFQGEYLGDFLFDTNEKKGYMLSEKVLSAINANTVERVKKFQFSEDISTIEKRGDDLSTFLSTNELLFFKGDRLLWRKEGPKVGLQYKLPLYAFIASTITSIVVLLAASYVNLWLAFLASIPLGLLIWYTADLYSASLQVDLTLFDFNNDGVNELLLHNNRNFVFLSHSQGEILKRISLNSEFKEVKVIKAVKKEDIPLLWVRAKKDETYYAIAITLEGIKWIHKGLHLTEVFDWDSNGTPELVSVSKEKLFIHTFEKDCLTEKNISVPYATYAGDIDGDSNQELVILGKTGSNYILYLVKQRDLFEYPLPLKPVFLDFLGVIDVAELEQDVILLKAIMEGKNEFLLYRFK